MTITFTTEKRDDGFGGWTRNCQLVGDDGQTYAYCVSVKRGKSVRIPYKPRGKNRGWKWNGAVYENGRCIWAGNVAGSIGVRGLLWKAGVFGEPDEQVQP